MSDSVRPHRRQPTRLPCPWDFPGKSTGVGCHCLLLSNISPAFKLYQKTAYVLPPFSPSPAHSGSPWNVPINVPCIAQFQLVSHSLLNMFVRLYSICKLLYKTEKIFFRYILIHAKQIIIYEKKRGRKEERTDYY